MRVTGIYNNVSLRTPLKTKKQKEVGSCPPDTNCKGKNNYPNISGLPFLGNIIYINDYIGEKNGKSIKSSNGAADFFTVQYFLNLPVADDAPQDIVSIFNSAYAIKNTIASVSDKFDNIYSDTFATICDVYENLIVDNSSWHCFKDGNQLVELDKRGNLLRETTFRDDFPEIIRDYKNNQVIFIESKKKDGSIKDFTVCLKCKNIDDPECIKSKESFSFKDGKPYRYCVSVSKDIYSDGFTASKAYTYKDNVLTGYDSQLTIAGGTEYSSKYYEFLPRINEGHLPIYGESVPVRYVTNKVVAKGYLIHSNEEIVLSRYLKDYAKL